MKAYKLEILVLDFDNVGDDIPVIIEDQRYPNHCISPRVLDVKVSDIGEWYDHHPLNLGKTTKEEILKYFE